MARRTGPLEPPRNPAVPRSIETTPRQEVDPPAAPPLPSTGYPGQNGGSQSPTPEWTAESRVGDPTVTAAELRGMGNILATRHLLTLLASRRRTLSRSEVIDEMASLLLELDDGVGARRLLLQMAEVGRIVDIYPLEVMVRIMERAPEVLPRTEFGPVILNQREITAQAWPVGEVISLRVPLNLRLKAFALQGGGTPGYTLAPGPPASYLLEMGDAGRYDLLFRGEVRRVSRVDRLRVRITDDSPTSLV